MVALVVAALVVVPALAAAAVVVVVLVVAVVVVVAVERWQWWRLTANTEHLLGIDVRIKATESRNSKKEGESSHSATASCHRANVHRGSPVL